MTLGELQGQVNVELAAILAGMLSAIEACEAEGGERRPRGKGAPSGEDILAFLLTGGDGNNPLNFNGSRSPTSRDPGNTVTVGGG